jgi:His-Xaa-Ser repeat protein HxsA
MRRSRFLISSLAAAGFGTVDPTVAALTSASAGGDDGMDGGKVFRTFRQDHLVTLAQHRSHRSHRSHSSHRSGAGGYSPRGGYSPPPAYRPPRSYSPPPAPTYSPTAPAYTPPDTTDPMAGGSAGTTPRTLGGRSTQFTSIVRRVQIGLLARGLYDGPIDGVVGPGLRSALRRLQTDNSLQVTGTITPEVLDALRVPSQ